MPSNSRPTIYRGAKRKRASGGTVAIRKASKQSARGRRNLPRRVLARSPFGRSNCYPFTRSVTQYLRAWESPDDTSLFDLNSDNSYYIMKMKMQLAELPDYDEFRSLFTQFKITSWTTTITPTMKDNIPTVGIHNPDSASWNQLNPATPNMEMFIIPATFNVHTSTRDWKTLSRDEIDDILNQTQLKARKIIPSKGFSFKTTNPMIVKTGFMPGKGNTTADSTEVYLGKAPWLENGAGPHQSGDPHPDQRLVQHYGFTVLCRRVDGGALTDLTPYHENNPGNMGWRVTRQAFFQMQKVR